MTYEEYRQQVVDACVELTGEENRLFWDTQCSFEEEYTDGIDPDEVAQNQLDSL